MNVFDEKVRCETFGEFISAKRREKAITSTYITDALNISPGYYCDIEKNRRNPPDRNTLAKIAQLLHLCGSDIDTFYDLAGKARSEAPPDLPEYINENEVVRVALRLAKENGGEDDWLDFIRTIERRRKTEGKTCYS